MCFLSNKSILVLLSFLAIATLSFCGFFNDKQFVSIDTMIYVFVFLFAYYAPLHQYITNANIHSYEPFTDFEYLYGNIIVLLFLVTYMFTKRYLKHKVKKLWIIEIDFLITDAGAILLTILSAICLLWLYSKHEVFPFVSNIADVDGTNDTLIGIITRIIRFFPAAALFLFTSAMKKGKFVAGKFVKYFTLILVFLIFAIVFNPIGGTMNRYILFGTFVMLLANWFEECQHKSYVLLVAIVGFYFVFPAFNFFKYNSFSNISSFEWGGFDVNSNDYDSYQVMLQTIRYVREHGIVWGKNILSAVLCIIPRSIWKSKSLPSGQLITEAINAEFTNVSCPLFAEFYLAFGLVGIVIGTILFGNLIKIIEYGNKKDNYYYRGLYFITIGIIMSYMRGAMLPVTSFWYSWIISFSCAYFACVFCNRLSES